MQCIGATTLDEYRQHIEKDSALERRFAPVYVDEPNIEDAIEILRGLRLRYEEHHAISYTEDALEQAVRLSHRYVPDRKLPDKAIDLIDEAAARMRVAMHAMPADLKQKKASILELTEVEEGAWTDRDYEKATQTKAELARLKDEFKTALKNWKAEANLDDVVDTSDIAAIVHSWTGIPVMDLLQEEMKKLLRMEDYLRQRIIGQERAIEAVSDAIRRARSGMKDPRRPIGTFLFLGPTGIGKTELAKVLAAFLFDSEDALLRVDMSEYREGHTVSRLFGAPPGYVGYEQGGQLTEKVRRRPYQVLLFDEIEKAHPEVWNTLLQIMDDGHMTDGQGRTVNFRNTVVIMTSNVGTESIKRGPLGFSTPELDENALMQGEYSKQIKRLFRPEFLNRIDETIIFDSLTRENVRDIVSLLMEEIAQRVDEMGIHVELTEAARDHLADSGFHAEYGARPLRRLLQKRIENELSKRLLRGEYRTGDEVVIDFAADEKEAENGLIFVRKEPEPIAVEWSTGKPAQSSSLEGSSEKTNA